MTGYFPNANQGVQTTGRDTLFASLMQQTMCLRLPVNRQGILASQGDSYGRRAVWRNTAVPARENTADGDFSALLFSAALRNGNRSLFFSRPKQPTQKKVLISAASQSRTSSEIQRGKIILGCTFVLIKGITSFRATAAYEWEKSEFYAKSIFFF